MPEPASNNGLPGDVAWLLGTYLQFGLPYTVGPMVGFVDRRPDLYPARESFLDRLDERLDRDALREMWADLDEYHIERAQRDLAAQAEDTLGDS